MLKKVWKGFLAVVTSLDAVTAEKSLAVLVVTRVLLAIGASASLVELIAKLGS